MTMPREVTVRAEYLIAGREAVRLQPTIHHTGSDLAAMAPAVIVDMIKFKELGYGLVTALADVTTIGGEDFISKFLMRSPEGFQTGTTRLLTSNRRLTATT